MYSKTTEAEVFMKMIKKKKKNARSKRGAWNAAASRVGEVT